MCNVKGVNHSDKSTLTLSSTVLPSSTEHFSIFQVIVLVFWLTNLLFWFPLLKIICSHIRQLFSVWGKKH